MWMLGDGGAVGDPGGEDVANPASAVRQHRKTPERRKGTRVVVDEIQYPAALLCPRDSRGPQPIRKPENPRKVNLFIPDGPGDRETLHKAGHRFFCGPLAHGGKTIRPFSRGK